MNAIKNWLSDDGVFQQGLLRFQRVLAKVLAVAMVVVIIALSKSAAEETYLLFFKGVLFMNFKI